MVEAEELKALTNRRLVSEINTSEHERSRVVDKLYARASNPHETVAEICEKLGSQHELVVRLAEARNRCIQLRVEAKLRLGFDVPHVSHTTYLMNSPTYIRVRAERKRRGG